MIKLLTFLSGKPPMTPAELKERWLNVHAPMALKFPGLRGYMLSFPVDSDTGSTADAIAQLWFDSREAAQESYSTDIGRSGSADANAFLARRAQMLASEEWMANNRSLKELPFKYLLAAKRNEGMTRADFVRWWRGEFARALVPLSTAGQMRVCVDEKGQLLASGVSGTLALRAGEALFDGLVEIWFDSSEGARAAHRDERPVTLCATKCSHIEAFALEEFVMRRPPNPAYGKAENAT
jgi:uncharacterized protein (TIGR02118 family)